jgi:hypothetical protein
MAKAAVSQEGYFKADLPHLLVFRLSERSRIQVYRNWPAGEGVVEPVLSIPWWGASVVLLDSFQTDR